MVRTKKEKDHKREEKARDIYNLYVNKIVNNIILTTDYLKDEPRRRQVLKHLIDDLAIDKISQDIDKVLSQEEVLKLRVLFNNYWEAIRSPYYTNQI